MSTRAEELARRVEQGAAELIAAVEGLSDAEWTTLCPDEQLRRQGPGREVEVGLCGQILLARPSFPSQPQREHPASSLCHAGCP